MKNVLNDISDRLGVIIADTTSVGGGCISLSYKVRTEDSKLFFLKAGMSESMSFAEAQGLETLRAANAIRVPQVIVQGKDYLLLEYIPAGHKSELFYVELAKGVAALHSCRKDFFGLSFDNFIGRTPQLNSIDNCETWSEYYVKKRLLPQYTLAEKNGYVDRVFMQLFDKLLLKANAILQTDDAIPVLLHGDLWGGNYVVDEKGMPCLIDPAIYYGHREADLAMTYLFGGFPSEFYAYYNDIHPLAAGWEDRLNIYKLYHMLNHLNMFGLSYKSEVLRLIKHYVS